LAIDTRLRAPVNAKRIFSFVRSQNRVSTGTMSIAQQITALIHANSSLAGPLSFFVTFFGCLLGTNLVVPAGAIMTAMGVLTGAGVISWKFALWAPCGAVLGMSASFAIGRRLGPRLQRIALLRAQPKLMVRARSLFEQFGFVAILIGYFSGPLRAPVAAVAAIAGMTRWNFELANLFSAVVWTVCSVGIGAVPGLMIDPNSRWLPVGLVLVPAATVGISVAIFYLRKPVQR
jgi:membrane protein DedA with SNARE-associated domain